MSASASKLTKNHWYGISQKTLLLHLYRVSTAMRFFCSATRDCLTLLLISKLPGHRVPIEWLTRVQRVFANTAGYTWSYTGVIHEPDLPSRMESCIVRGASGF
jgi:hypothetical protein